MESPDIGDIFVRLKKVAHAIRMKALGCKGPKHSLRRPEPGQLGLVQVEFGDSARRNELDDIAADCLAGVCEEVVRLREENTRLRQKVQDLEEEIDNAPIFEQGPPLPG